MKKKDIKMRCFCGKALKKGQKITCSYKCYTLERNRYSGETYKEVLKRRKKI